MTVYGLSFEDYQIHHLEIRWYLGHGAAKASADLLCCKRAVMDCGLELGLSIHTIAVVTTHLVMRLTVHMRKLLIIS